MRYGPTPRSALVDRDDAPAALETIDSRHRERIDDKTQRAVGIKIKRDGERGADRTGMHDEHDIARRQWSQPCIRAGNLIDKTFATGRPVAGRGFPEILVGVAKLGDEIPSYNTAVAAGKDPKGLIRDAQFNRRVELPNIGRKLYTEGMTLAQYREHPFWSRLLEDFRWHYGQPEEVRREFREAMGLEAESSPR